MLPDSKLPTTFWAEAVNIACYVQNRVLVVKPYSKTPYELFHGTKACDDACKASIETVPGKDYILLPLWTADPSFSQSSKCSPNDGSKPSSDDEKKVDEDPRKDSESVDQEKDNNVNSTNNVNAASTNEVNAVGGKISIELPDDPNMPALEDIVYSDADEDNGAEADMNNLDTTIQVSPIPTTRIHKDHPLNQVIGDLQSATQTRNMSKNLEEYGTQKGNSCIERSKLDKGYAGRASTIQATRSLDLSGFTKWKKGYWQYTQEEGIDYNEVFAPIARIEAIRLFLAYALFKDFVVYQMDVNSAFLYGKIEEEVYVCQPPGFEDPDFPDKRGKIDKTLFIRMDKGDILLAQVYVDDIIFGSTKKSLCTEFEKMMHKKFQMSSMGELTFFLRLQVKQKEDGIFITSTPMETQKPLLKDEDGEEVDVYLYRSMVGSLMYLTSSRPDIMFAVCTYARCQYPKDSPFDLVAYTDSDYAGASLDKISTTGEAEYVAASSCYEQVLWIQSQLLDYGVKTPDTDQGNPQVIFLVRGAELEERSELRFLGPPILSPLKSFMDFKSGIELLLIRRYITIH
ncbi:putative ribonuclease H-like domain-containing protein [Tanacetum coccineum]